MPKMQTTSLPSDNSPKVLEMSDVLDKVDSMTHDVVGLRAHIRSGTETAYYIQMLDSIIWDLTVIPIDRSFHNVETSDTESSVAAGFDVIVESFSVLFGKDKSQVEKDLTSRMNDFPVDDVRTARLFKHQNRLN